MIWLDILLNVRWTCWNPQDTCSPKSRACFFWGRRSAAGSHHADAPCWEILKSQQMINSRIYMLQNPGMCFFWGRRSAAGSDHQTHRAGDHNLESKQCQRNTLSKNSGAKPCQRNILSKSYILTVSDGIFWVSPIYLLYLMEYFE